MALAVAKKGGEGYVIKRVPSAKKEKMIDYNFT